LSEPSRSRQTSASASRHIQSGNDDCRLCDAIGVRPSSGNKIAVADVTGNKDDGRMMEFLAELSLWEIYAIVCGLLGALGILFGAIARKKFVMPLSVLPLIGIAMTTPVTERFVIPHLADRYPVVFANKDLPKKIDPQTTLKKVDLTDSIYSYFYDLDLDDDWFDAPLVKSAQLSDLCSSLLPKFISGEASLANYIYQLKGKDYSFSVDSSDCL